MTNSCYDPQNNQTPTTLAMDTSAIKFIFKTFVGVGIIGGGVVVTGSFFLGKYYGGK